MQNQHPGESTNFVKWEKYLSKNGSKNYLIIDKRKNLKMISESISLDSLASKLLNDERLDELEKCVVLLQIFMSNEYYHQAPKSFK